MSLININNLSFSYPGSYENVFENVSFQIDTSWKLGFIGRNGRGKTTFLNLLMGKYDYSGSITSNVDFEYFPFPVANNEDYVIDIITEIAHTAEHWEIEKELSKLEVDIDVLYRPFNTLSNGEQTKALLAAMFLKENSFLLIDEPTNHLDANSREIVSAYLKSKQGFILVSHDRSFVDSCVNHILSINRTNIEVQKGNFSSWFENKEKLEAFEERENNRLKKEIKELSVAQKQLEGWSDKLEKTKFGTKNSGLRPDRGYIGAKAARTMKRSKNAENRIEKAIEQKSSLLKNAEEVEKLFIPCEKHHSRVYAYGKGLSLFYSETPVIENLSFEITGGSRVSISGKNGSGKTSLLKLLAGKEINYTGTFEVASGLKISYLPQDTSFLAGNLKDFAIANGIDISLFFAILRKLDFDRTHFEKDMAGYSAGQKKKVLIAKSLCEKANLYLWDEPLNYIDIYSRMQVEDMILRSNPTMVFIEHDRKFSSSIATDFIELKL